MRIFRLITICFIFITLLSCENSVPDVVSVDAFLVCDFYSEQKEPKYSLAVFTNVSSDVCRISSMNISSMKDGYEWYIENPVLFNASMHKYSGYGNLIYPNNVAAPNGMYKVVYTDLAGQTDEASFILDYADKIISAKYNDFPKVLGDGWKQEIAVFAENDIMIFFGEQSEDLKTDSDIFERYKDAKYFRRCYKNMNGSVLCMMIPVLRNEN